MTLTDYYDVSRSHVLSSTRKYFMWLSDHHRSDVTLVYAIYKVTNYKYNYHEICVDDYNYFHKIITKACIIKVLSVDTNKRNSNKIY